MQDELQRSNSENLKKIVTDYSKQIKTISQSVVDDTIQAIRQNSKTLNEETKKFNQELKKIKRTHFSFLSNACIYITLGILACLISIFAWNFFKIQNGFYKELAENQKLESIRKEAVNEYKKELMNPDAKEISKMIEKWNKKNK